MSISEQFYITHFFSYYEQQIGDYAKKLPSDFAEAFKYVSLPGGKFFRAQLLLHLCYDLCKNFSDRQDNDFVFAPYYPAAHGLELHHLYTLLHDDLPAMDNDNMRRGKLSAHKKFQEFTAILLGDGLLNLSYQYFTQALMPSQASKNMAPALSMLTKLLGMRGLILGQYLDLSCEQGHIQSSASLRSQIQTLKTSRLIQCSTLLPLYLIRFQGEAVRLYDVKIHYQIGDYIGLCFQLYDDAQDGEYQISLQQDEQRYQKYLGLLETLLAQKEYDHTLSYVQEFFPRNFSKSPR